MSFNFGLNKYDGVGPLKYAYEEPTGQAAPRTLRQQLQDQIAFHRSKVDDLQAAVESLTPDVEKALNALQKL